MLAGVALAETINFHNLTVGPASPLGGIAPKLAKAT
jgi:hypothetical protein